MFHMSWLERVSEIAGIIGASATGLFFGLVIIFLMERSYIRSSRWWPKRKRRVDPRGK